MDNASSMDPYWDEATFLLHMMEQKIHGYDSNGIDLRFTRPRVQPVNHKTPLHRKLIGRPKLRVSWEAEMRANAPVVGEFAIRTSMSSALSAVFNEFLPLDVLEMSRKFTLIVLTDGLWEGDPDAVRKYIKTFMRKAHTRWNQNLAVSKDKILKDSHRPISIQFVQFGSDLEAFLRMRHLDNGLAFEKDFEDIG